MMATMAANSVTLSTSQSMSSQLTSLSDSFDLMSTATSNETRTQSRRHSCSPPSLPAAPITKCPLCSETYVSPKVMSCCFSTFCQSCLEKLLESPDRLKCPSCGHECLLPPNGISGLVTDHSIVNMLERIASFDSTMSANSNIQCTGCKSKEQTAVSRCFDCANFLCPNCVMAHQFMHCFEGHQLMSLGEGQGKDVSFEMRVVTCPRHGEEQKYYCRTCDVPLCKECCVFEHPKGLHEHEYLSEAAPKHVSNVSPHHLSLSKC